MYICIQGDLVNYITTFLRLEHYNPFRRTKLLKCYDGGRRAVDITRDPTGAIL